MTFKGLVATLSMAAMVPQPLRRRLLFIAGVHAMQAVIESGVRFENTNVSLGRGVYLNRGVTIEGNGRVTIGANVAIAPDVLIAGVPAAVKRELPSD